MTVRVGFLGAGLIATYHSKSLRASKADVTWAGVFDPEPGRTEAFARASGAEPCATEDEVLDGCDAVYVCTWTAEHPRLVAAAAERGLAVFCEKPLATNLAGAAAMAADVEQAGVINQVGLVLRSSPAFSLLRSLIAEEASGMVMSIIFRDDQFIPIQGSYGSTWRADVAKAGAGTLLEHSIHDIDIIESLVGPLDSVSARSAGFHAIEGIEDVVSATLSMAGGGVGTLVSVWHDLLERPSLRRVEVLCERGFFTVEGDWFGPVSWTRTGGESGSLEGEALLAEVARRGLPMPNPDGAFIEAIEGDRPAFPDFAVALRAHAVVDAIYRSCAGGGSRVDIPAPAG
jgi:predicted dehydrogenase